MPAKLETQIVGNIGMYYACYQLSKLGWNVMPTARNAKGIDIIAYSPDGKSFLGIQVKTLSKRNPIPVGASLDKVMGDFWIVVTKAVESTPDVYIFTPEEIRKMAHQSGSTWWVEPTIYDKPLYRDAWGRIGTAPVSPAKCNNV